MKQLNITSLFIVLLSMTGFNASAHDIEVKNADGVTIYYNYINNNTELSVTYRGSSYSDYSNEYTGNVIIPVSVAYNGKTYSVTSIGIQAFYDCSGLTSVTIPESVKSLGHGVFMNCTGLTSITIPESVKSIGQSAFYGTAWYDNQPDGLVYAGKVAYKYKGTMPENTSIVLNEGTTSISSYAFQNCSNLISVAIPNSVTNIGSYAFCQCSSLTSIEIPNSVTETGDNAFTGTPWYENQPDGLVYAGKVAYKYKGTMPENTSIVLNDGTASVSPFAFYDCSSLISITIPESVTNIDNRAFQNCSGITSLIIPNSVTSIGKYAFSGCSGISSIIVSSGNKKYDSRENCNAIIETASKTLVVGCKNTIIPHSVTSIGEYAFENCSGLTSITIPNSVTKIGQDAFFGTAWYENQPDGLVYAGKVAYMYKGTMPENTSIVLNDGTVSISAFAFANRTGLTSITIPESVTSISSYAFQNCSSLISVAIPNSVTTIGRMAFSWCSALSSIIVLPGNTKYDSRENCNAIIETASNTLIAGCKNTIIPNNVTIIGDHAFSGCSGLTSITIPESVTSIGTSAFPSCSGLASVTIPNSVTSIGEWAFSGCSALKNVYNGATIPQALASDLGFNYTTATLHVPAGTKELYQAADYWKNFSNIVEDINTVTVEDDKEPATTVEGEKFYILVLDKEIVNYAEIISVNEAGKERIAIKDGGLLIIKGDDVRFALSEIKKGDILVFDFVGNIRCLYGTLTANAAQQNSFPQVTSDEMELESGKEYIANDDCDVVLEMETTESPVELKSITITEPTGVSIVETSTSNPSSCKTYNLAGQQVNAGSNGLLIQNGKKIIKH